MNDAQRKYLKLLCDEAGEPFDETLDEEAAEPESRNFESERDAEYTSATRTTLWRPRNPV